MYPSELRSLTSPARLAAIEAEVVAETGVVLSVLPIGHDYRDEVGQHLLEAWRANRDWRLVEYLVAPLAVKVIIHAEWRFKDDVSDCEDCYTELLMQGVRKLDSYEPKPEGSNLFAYMWTALTWAVKAFCAPHPQTYHGAPYLTVPIAPEDEGLTVEAPFLVDESPIHVLVDVMAHLRRQHDPILDEVIRVLGGDQVITTRYELAREVGKRLGVSWVAVETKLRTACSGYLQDHEVHHIHRAPTTCSQCGHPMGRDRARQDPRCLHCRAAEGRRQVRELLEQGKTVAEVAAQLGISRELVEWRLKAKDRPRKVAAPKPPRHTCEYRPPRTRPRCTCGKETKTKSGMCRRCSTLERRAAKAAASRIKASRRVVERAWMAASPEVKRIARRRAMLVAS